LASRPVLMLSFVLLVATALHPRTEKIFMAPTRCRPLSRCAAQMPKKSKGFSKVKKPPPVATSEKFRLMIFGKKAAITR
jgi:hypothetical protein